MRTATSNTELPPVTMALPGDQYNDLVRDNAILLEQKIALRAENDRLSEQLYKAMQEAADYRKENERINEILLKRSTDFEQTRLRLVTSNIHLFKMLDEHEGAFDADEKFESAEICRDYLDAAMYCEKYMGRKENRVRQAQEWYDNLNPWEQTDKLKNS